MTIQVEKTAKISGSKINLGDLRALILATSNMKEDVEVKINYTPRDRPFDSESYSISVSGPENRVFEGRD